MPDFSKTRSEYMKIMMGDRQNALAPYRPEQMNDLGDTSFDVASLSDDDINLAISRMTGTQYEGTDLFSSLQSEQASRKQKAEDENREKSWLEQIGDFFSNIGTSITEGVLNVVDNVWDFTVGTTAGLFGGGWFGAQNDFTDWAAKAMTDDRWVDYATKGLTQLDVFDKGFWTNEGGYWSDWSHENIVNEQNRDYEGMDWLHKGGNFVGYIIPSLVLAYFTGGASIGAQAAAQGGLALASAYGQSASQALEEGASFQGASGYGAIRGIIAGAMSAGMTYAGGTLASRGADTVISKVGNKVGDAILKKTGSTILSATANNATKIIIRVAGDAGEAAVMTAIDPAFKMIYDENAWYNAYGTEENRKAYAEEIGKAALTAAAISTVANVVRSGVEVHRAGGVQKYLENYEQSSYQRIAENDVLKNLSRSERRLVQEGSKEWQSIQADMDALQAEYNQMVARNAPQTEIDMFIGRNRELIAERVRAYSSKYGSLFTKLSAKFHPDVVGQSGNASLDASRNAAFQKYTSMTSKGAKEQVASLFNGKDGVVALIEYTSGSEPVETAKENGVVVAKPKTQEQLTSVLAAIADDKTNAPSIIALPLRTGEIRLSIASISPKQLQGLAFLREGDFQTNSNGALIANLGEGKSFALTSDKTAGQIIPTEEAQAWVQPTEEAFKPVETDLSPETVKAVVQGKPGKVYSLSSAKSVVTAIEDSIQELLSLDNLGGETKLDLPKGATARELFNTLNLGTDEQKAQLQEYFKNKLLDMNVGYELKDYYGDVLDQYSGTWREFLATMDKSEIQKFDADFNRLYNELLASGDDTNVSKVINKFAEKLTKAIEAYKELKTQTKLTGHIEKHKTKILQRYYHNDGTDFGPDFDFDTKGYRVLLEPLHQLKQTPGKQSYTGSSAVKAFKQFLDNYKMENFTKSFGENSDGVYIVSSIYNQGLRDVANALVESIENSSYTDKNGKVIYSALDSKQLALLRLFQDEVEKMPKRATADTLEAVGVAKSAYHGVERYVSSVIKNGNKVGIVRNFVQGYSERYANPLDTLMFEVGDNDLSRTIYNQLYLAQAQAAGMRDDFQTKIEEARKQYGITNKKLNAESSFVDSAGKPIEKKYLARIYQHLMAGEDSNNVKYIESNTVYIRDSKGKLVHIAKFSYSDLEAIKSELEASGIIDYAKYLHKLENEDLGDIYDQDYLRDTHIPNSNRIKEYTAIQLESNRSELGKAYVKSGVAKYGHQKDRVTSIPKGVHLVIQDAESALMSQVGNQANIHFNDPVLKRINGMLNTRLDKSGGTVREYLVQHNPGALKIIERAVNGAYGINPNKSSKLIDFAGNGYVMTLIGFNPGSVLRQPLSIMWSNDISMASVLKFTLGANLNPTIWKNSSRLIEEIEREFPDLRLRGKKNESLMGNVAADAVGRVQNAIGKVAGFGLKVTDYWTVGHEAIGLLSLQAQRLGYGEIGTPENDEYVKYHYRAFYATQVSSNRMLMSGARAGYYGGLGKLTSFMTGAVQGQIGYILRAAQQLSEYAGKTQGYYDALLEKTKQAEEQAKLAYEEAQQNLSDAQEAYEQGEIEFSEVKTAREQVRDAFDDYTQATGERADAETSAKGFKHFKEMGGAKGVVLNRAASMLITGLMMVLISELTARLKGQKEWNEFDASSAGADLAINTLGGWMPIVRDLVSAWKGYDLEIPEYMVVKQAYELISAIGAVAKDPSNKNARSLLKQAIESVSAFLGIPAMNLWKYANGIIKTFSPATALRMNSVLYGMSATSLTSTAKEYAENNDISTSADLYQTLYSTFKTGEIQRDVAVEEAKLVREGFNPIARNVPDYVMNENNEKVMLSDDQKSDFMKVYSRSNAQVAKLIKQIGYKNMDSESKAKAIKKVYDLYYEAARSKALGIDPDSRLGKLLAYASDYDDDIIATLLLIHRNSQLADNRRSTKKEQAVRLVNSQPMTRIQKLLTLYLMGYGVTSDNKKQVQRYLVSLGFTKKQAEEFLPS